MLFDSTVKTTGHLQRLIITRNGKIPNFALLLGAGASRTSNVITGVDMIGEWRRIMCADSGSADCEAWIAEQNWYEHDDEYSMLFEQIYDRPAQRRVYIEECLKDAHPTWGYAYLTNLLTHHYFDVVFTTNFDDLINEACYLYSDEMRPIVAAHDSAIQGIRVTSDRPKIIKLHGDFLYDNIKNTLGELETLEENTKRKLHQFAQEYGLVVIGYSGRDRSVMDTLDVLLRDDNNFKQGIYWCTPRGEQPSRRLRSLLRRDRVYLVEIDGFDQFLADLHELSGEQLPTALAHPFEIARKRADFFVKLPASLELHPIIQKHKNALLQSIREDVPELPLTMQASILGSMGQTDDAVLLWERVYRQDPQDVRVAYRYADALANAGQLADLGEFVRLSPLDNADKAYFYLRSHFDEEVVSLATTVLDGSLNKRSDLPPTSAAILRINRAIALKRLGHTEDMEADLDFLEGSRATSRPNIKAGVAALRGDREGMFTALKDCMHKLITPHELLTFPVFEDYQDDPEFIDFVDSSNEDVVDRTTRRQHRRDAQEEQEMPGPNN